MIRSQTVLRNTEIKLIKQTISLNTRVSQLTLFLNLQANFIYYQQCCLIHKEDSTFSKYNTKRLLYQLVSCIPIHSNNYNEMSSSCSRVTRGKKMKRIMLNHAKKN